LFSSNSVGKAEGQEVDNKTLTRSIVDLRLCGHQSCRNRTNKNMIELVLSASVTVHNSLCNLSLLIVAEFVKEVKMENKFLPMWG